MSSPQPLGEVAEPDRVAVLDREMGCLEELEVQDGDVLNIRFNV
jgi:hypothetical protein